MHEMQTIVTDVLGVCLSVSLPICVTRLKSATARAMYATCCVPLASCYQSYRQFSCCYYREHFTVLCTCRVVLWPRQSPGIHITGAWVGTARRCDTEHQLWLWFCAGGKTLRVLHRSQRQATVFVHWFVVMISILKYECVTVCCLLC